MGSGAQLRTTERDAVFVTREGIASAMRRAVAFRMAEARAMGATVQLNEAIEGQPAPVERVAASMDADGWVNAGTVFDTIGGALAGGSGLSVRWHPATDRVRVARPPGPAPETPPYVWDGLYHDGPRSIRARPGYRHERDGVPACGACAASTATIEGTERWGSRLLLDGERYACELCGADVAG